MTVVTLVEDLSVSAAHVQRGDMDALTGLCPWCSTRNARGSIARGVFLCGCGCRGRVKTGTGALLDYLRQDSSC